MKIIQIIPNLKKGGAERLTLDICIELNKREGIEVCLITFSDENDYLFLSEKINHIVIPSKVIPSITGKSVQKTEQLQAFIKSYNPHIIHSHLFEAEIISRWDIIKEIKYFSHCHDNMHQLNNCTLHDLTTKKRLTELYEKHLICRQYKKCNNAFITISEHTKTYFEKVLPPPLNQNVSLLHNAIKFDSFYTKRIKQDELVLINIGSFVDKKNQKLLVPIVQTIQAKGTKCRAILLGNGKLHKKTTEEIKKQGIEDSFTLPGNVKNGKEWLNQATIYVHTAIYEPFGLVLLEAMASGLPVVSLDGGGNRDIIENGKNGFMIDEQNPELFADKILEIWQNKELYKTMSNYAQEYAKKYDIKPYVDQLLKIYNQ